MSLSAAEIFAAEPEIHKYTVESMNGEIYVRLLTTADRKKMAKFCKTDLEGRAIMANIIYGVCNQDGERLFKETDLQKLCDLPELKIAAMFTAVTQANKINEKDVAKNS